jgi:hypothetical protein
MDYTQTSDTIKPIVNISATIEEINKHTEQVLKGEYPCPVSNCPKCHEQSDYFMFREAKPRIFYVVVEQVIQVVDAFLSLWKCPECGKCFMGYPPFAMPYKRYTAATICEFTRQYVENDKMSYRGVINQTPLLSETKPERELSHTTIHRWITTLGRMDMTLARAQDLIMQANPLSTISRDMAAVEITCRKYTTEARKTLLLTCRKILKTATRFCQQFGVSIFHHLAPKNAYR